MRIKFDAEFEIWYWVYQFHADLKKQHHNSNSYSLNWNNDKRSEPAFLCLGSITFAETICLCKSPIVMADRVTGCLHVSADIYLVAKVHTDSSSVYTALSIIHSREKWKPWLFFIHPNGIHSYACHTHAHTHTKPWS